MCEVFWHLIIARLEVVVTVKMGIVKYISNKLAGMISTDEAYIRFQYFVIYLNLLIQDTMWTFRGVGKALQLLLHTYGKVI